MAVKTFAVTPGFSVGGAIFTSKQLALIGSVIGDEAKVEMTTFKQLYVTIEEDRIPDVQLQLEEVDLEIHQAGFVSKSLITCNFCKGAVEAGLDVAKALDLAIANHEVPSPLKIGYAGCALGTSEPLLKDIAVVKMRDSFDLYVGGEAKGLKPSFAKLLVSNLQKEQLIPITMKLINIFQTNGKKKEKFSKFVDRMTLEELRASV
ncbi:nitrite reductase [Paenibacillus sp. GSMTC-2017]|uniref:nitrite reductase n=1 Tax=Paenibacillus sp. GSMTC-2017 TaxID=2794350 RepID=UPI0018D7CAD9|nr:nitrite reductase [Paenibacillus sp. GSMTC-2017]MBH5317863.1 nitrite reductase [Paenibacillus sp. GSMTC-2017]